MSQLDWGIDLGGTKIECAVLRNGEVLKRERIPTEAERGYDHILAQVTKLISKVADELGEMPSKVGFATPGVRDTTSGLMKNCNTVSMNGRPMKEDLEALLGTEVSIANDANCFALAETIYGAGKDLSDAEVVFGVIMGTGVGGGLVFNKKIISGANGIAGEWGHNVLEENGALCYCGKRGCVESVISGVALERYYTEHSGKTLKLPEIVANHYLEKDAVASQTIERLLENFGKAVSVLINIIDPDLIIIGGGVGNIDLLYTEGVERINKYAFDTGTLNTKIRKPILGDSAGVFGAALLNK